MAWASVGLAGSTGNTVNNQTAITITLNGQAGSGGDVGDVLIGTFACDNASSVSDIDAGAVSGVADDALNTWTKAIEIQNGGAAAQAGAVVSLWYTKVENALTTVQTVVASLTSTATRDATAGRIWRFTNAGTVNVSQSTFVTVATSLSGTLDLTEAATEFLRFRGVAAETTLTAFTTTSGWNSIGMSRSGATVGVEVAAFGEYLITSATTAASACRIAAATDQASVYATFQEVVADLYILMGDGIY
jgi:hypothetical protein